MLAGSFVLLVVLYLGHLSTVGQMPSHFTVIIII